MISERIQLARQASGLSLRDAAEAAGVSHTAIANYEKGCATPSSDILLKLAGAYGVRVEYFFRQQAVTLGEVEYRKHARVPKKVLDKVRGSVREQVERFLELHSYLPTRPVMAFAVPPDLPEAVESLDAIEDLALAVRAAWGLGQDPIPVLTDMLEERGILVIQCADMPVGKVDGLAATLDGIPVIVVGRDWPGDRQRFTMAHELGHLLLKGRLAPGLDPEKAANRFAGAFLAPKPEVLKELGPRRTWLEPRELCVLKATYGLSMGAWLFRARDLGILGAPDYLRMVKHFRRMGWHNNEPCTPYPRENPQLFEQMVFHAIAEDFVSESKAAELLAMPLSDFRALRNLETVSAPADQ